METAVDKLKLAQRHLERVRTASYDPIDWDDLSLYGFYCLENAVQAAAIHFKIRISRKHWQKADVATKLHKKYGLPDIHDLITNLNQARKAKAYGDIPIPDLDAEEVACEIENYVEEVGKALSQ
jgi:hypothetical protein